MDIFTDVPGVAIIDPTIVPYTKYIKNISYDNMYKLASNGVKVIHPKSVLIGKKFNIPVRITSTLLTQTGTFIQIQVRDKIIGIAVKNENENKIFYIFTNENILKACIKGFNNFL